MNSPINLIIQEVKEFHPEPQEWPTMEIDGKEVEITPAVILAMIPAVGWHAVFVNFDDPEKIFRKPIACFGLHLEDDGSQSVVGLVNQDKALLPAEWSSDFLGYEGPDENSEDEWEFERLDWIRMKSTEYRDLGDNEIHPHEN